MYFWCELSQSHKWVKTRIGKWMEFQNCLNQTLVIKPPGGRKVAPLGIVSEPKHFLPQGHSRKLWEVTGWSVDWFPRPSFSLTAKSTSRRSPFFPQSFNPKGSTGVPIPCMPRGSGAGPPGPAAAPALGHGGPLRGHTDPRERVRLYWPIGSSRRPNPPPPKKIMYPPVYYKVKKIGP